MKYNKSLENIFVTLVTVLCFYANVQGQRQRNETEKTTELTQVSANSNDTESGTIELYTDVQWFLEGIANFAEAAEHVLPDATAIETENRAAEFHLSNYLLYGLKQFFIGIKDITNFALYAFGHEDTTRQSRQYTHTKLLLTDLGRYINGWFKSLRWMFAKFMELYNYYLTELLLGKCVGSYLISAYPNRAYYEYPFLIIYEIFKYFVYAQKDNFVNSLTTEDVMDTIGADLDAGKEAQNNDIGIAHTTEEISIEQNEIPDNDFDNYVRRRSMRERVLSDRARFNTSAEAALESDNNESSFQSLQKCLKIYAAETMIGKIRKMFL